jgi:hypothetical protein
MRGQKPEVEHGGNARDYDDPGETAKRPGQRRRCKERPEGPHLGKPVARFDNALSARGLLSAQEPGSGGFLGHADRSVVPIHQWMGGKCPADHRVGFTFLQFQHQSESVVKGVAPLCVTAGPTLASGDDAGIGIAMDVDGNGPIVPCGPGIDTIPHRGLGRRIHQVLVAVARDTGIPALGGKGHRQILKETIGLHFRIIGNFGLHKQAVPALLPRLLQFFPTAGVRGGRQSSAGKLPRRIPYLGDFHPVAPNSDGSPGVFRLHGWRMRVGYRPRPGVGPLGAALRSPSVSLFTF